MSTPQKVRQNKRLATSLYPFGMWRGCQHELQISAAEALACRGPRLGSVGAGGEALRGRSGQSGDTDSKSGTERWCGMRFHGVDGVFQFGLF